ncbi:synaptophysin-like protein 2b [Paramormyrops kingsleyae]|uniref:Synaptophysin-like protein 1 n=1 Tax=Paramormyrops kingsleyae TaxID=1676925 RepID=A0A3B3T2B5_9TELE|nr:synaptophysin-like protein 1 [Paramormyrops kingsleyae]
MEGRVQKVVSDFKPDLGLLKEPLGFLRVLEWVFSVFAFATVGGYSGSTSINIQCADSQLQEITAHFYYPFRLPSYPFHVPTCNGSSSGFVNTFLVGDFSPSVEFFVCVGVLAFLYCIVTLVVYLGYRHIYRGNSRAPILDLLVTGTFAFMWLVSSSAWAKALSDIKMSTSPSFLVRVISTCKILGNGCTPGALPSTSRLNVSVIFGFLNLILWGSNCWFIYKDTPFHKAANTQAEDEEGGPSAPPPTSRK